MTEGLGGWKGNLGEVMHEPVQIYDIAVDERQFRMLSTIAAWVALVGNQDQVYLRRPDGVIESVPAGGSDLVALSTPWIMKSRYMRKAISDMEAQENLELLSAELNEKEAQERVVSDSDTGDALHDRCIHKAPELVVNEEHQKMLEEELNAQGKMAPSQRERLLGMGIVA